MPTPPVSRRAALKAAAAGLAAPAVFRSFAHAAPSETVLHVSVGAGGRAAADLAELMVSKHLKLVAAADVDANAAAALKKKFPDVRTYADWREMFDKEKFDSVSVGTPDHTHAAPTMRALKTGKHVFTQKPLTQTIAEARALTEAARTARVATQMGIQIHSAAEHKTTVAAVRSGVVGKVKEVHSWSGKEWGDPAPKPDRADPVPAHLNWNLWVGPAAERPYIAGYYHPGAWRKRTDFGCGTFGDMGCHILDPVFGALALTAPTSVRSGGEPPNATNWALEGQVTFNFPATPYAADGGVAVTWYNGHRRPPEAITRLVGKRKLHDQGSIYVGTTGVLYSPYVLPPVVLPPDGAAGPAVSPPALPKGNHFVEWVEAARGNGATSTPFSYSGPLTEMVLLGCLATRFPKTTLQWDAAAMTVTNVSEANRYVRREYRKGFEEPGL